MTTTTRDVSLMRDRLRPDNELIRKHGLPRPRQSVEYTFHNPDRERVLLFRRNHQSERDRRGEDIQNSEAGLFQQISPALPHVETKMSPVEQAFVVLREASEQDIPPEPEIPAVRQRGDQL